MNTCLLTWKTVGFGEREGCPSLIVLVSCLSLQATVKTCQVKLSDGFNAAYPKLLLSVLISCFSVGLHLY